MTVASEHLISTIEPVNATREARLVPFRVQVQRHLLAMVRDKSLAEELTQDTYARAFERIGQLRDPQAALAWLYRIATTVALDRLRQPRPSTVPLDTVAPVGGEAEQADGEGCVGRHVRLPAAGQGAGRLQVRHGSGCGP